MGSESQAVQMAVGSRGSGPGGHHLVTDRLHLTTSSVRGLSDAYCTILYNSSGSQVLSVIQVWQEKFDLRENCD